MRVSNHAIERYSQRILGRPNSTIRTLSTDEVEKIKHQIEDCISDENMLYEQLPYRNENGDFSRSDIYLYKNIVPIYDRDTNCVITIYNVDLGFDDAVNKKYVTVLKNKIKEIKTNKQKDINDLTTKIRKCNSLIGDHQDEIRRLEEEIEKYKSAIKSVSRVRKQYQDERKELEDEMDTEVKTLVTTMIKRK